MIKKDKKILQNNQQKLECNKVDFDRIIKIASTQKINKEVKKDTQKEGKKSNKNDKKYG